MPELPLPEIEDLSSSLTHLNRRTAVKRRQLANQPTTRAIIAAGLSLIEEQFVQEKVSPTEREDDPRGLMRFLSRGSVLRRASELHPDLRIGVGLFRDRWSYQPDFVADLIRVAIQDKHWSLRVARGAAVEVLTEGSEFAKAIHEIAYQDLADSRVPAYRFQLVAAATSERDPVVREALTRLYEAVTASWVDVYASTLESRNLQLRSGMTMRMFADILTATAEGLALRMLADPGAPVVDDEKRTSLLGTAAIALAVAAIDVRGDGMTMEQVLEAGLHGSRPPE